VRDAAEWLKEHVPPLNSDDLVVVHGDYRFGNLIWQGTKLVAILDWERATIGHPMQDLGFMCMRMARQRNPQLMGMVATLDELGTLYEKATGRVIDLPSVHYFSMLAQFVEAALVPIGLAYACDIDRPPYVVALTVYPQLNAAVRNLVQDIEDFESGRYVL
jgi:aminoglycoside phosphotransferase (APT) family kinase protein